MRYVVIDNGIVENAILADEGFVIEGKTLVQSDTAQIGQLWDGTDFSDPAPEPITSDQVNTERTRRILAGGTFLSIPVTGDDQTITNLTNLAFGASLRVGSGDTTTITVYRDAVNADHDLTPLQIIGLWQASAAYVSSLYQKSWDLKTMDPIPLDYTDESYWT